jgi:probable metal-binding protein
MDITAPLARMDSGASTPELEIPMSEPLYGHDLLSLLLAKGGTCRLEDLRAASQAAHGDAAVYCNCSGDSFDFDGVLAFLGSKGKVSVAEGTVSLGLAPACQH